MSVAGLKWRCQQRCIPFEMLGGILYPCLSSCSHSLAGGCITSTSASAIMGPSLMLTFLSLFDKDPCDYFGLTHTIQDNLPTSRSWIADALSLPHALPPPQCYLGAYVRALVVVWIRTLIPCVTLGKSLSFSGSQSPITIHWGAEERKEQGSQTGRREIEFVENIQAWFGLTTFGFWSYLQSINFT